jgi:hypothetical protein
LSRVLKISGVRSLGIRKVYDIEMPSEPNFVLANGVVAHNCSHAVSYSVISYACAWLKHHYPLEWWCSILQHATKEEINDKFWKYCGHLVELPDLQLSKAEWFIDGEKIRAPLSILHGVGEKAHAQLVKYAPYTSLEDFVHKMVLHKKNNHEMKQVLNKKTEEYENKEVWGRSAINSGMVHSMMIAGCMDSLVKEYETIESAYDAYGRFLKAISKEEGGKDSPVKKVPNLDPLGRYQKRKQILPAWGVDLRPLVAAIKLPDFIFFEDQRLYCRWSVWGEMKEEPVIGGKGFMKLVRATELPEGGFVANVIAYIEVRRDFGWGQDKQKQACQFTLEVGGEKFDAVWWPDREGKLSGKVALMGEGAVVAVRLSKFNANKPFSIQDMAIIRESLKDDSKEESP